MSRIIVATCIAAVALAIMPVTAQGPGKGDVQVRDPWARATPPGAKVAAGYLEIRNSGNQPDRVIGASTPVAERVELHVQVRDGDTLKMRQVKSFEIPARGQLTLRPGGSHLMLFGPKKPFVRGENIPLTLRFERAGELQVELEVQSADTPSQAHH